jgi:hypothetical protein
MRTRFIAPLAAAALSAAMLGGAALPATAAPGPSAAVGNQLRDAATAVANIDQTIAGVGRFVGTFTPTDFFNRRGQLQVEGVLNGTFTNLLGQTATVNRLFTTTVIGGSASQACQILNLDLGPLDLNLLGLEIHLDEIHLDIVAVPGPGNLLGNLLCGIAGLLDGTGGNGLASLLNRLLGL